MVPTKVSEIFFMFYAFIKWCLKGIAHVVTYCSSNDDALNHAEAGESSGEETVSDTDEDSQVVSDTPSGSAYQVFLSFRGPDTRKTFTDMLYVDLVSAGVRVFRDDEELRTGVELGPELLTAIRQSKICIPVFSKDYASSKWCLKELRCAVKCRKRKDMHILPIFYDVEPADVKHPGKGCYAKALLQHGKEFDDKTIRRWKRALRNVCKLKGQDVQTSAGGYQGRLVKEVVSQVLTLLGTSILYEGENVVGIEDHTKEIIEKLDTSCTNQVRMIGIYGMGGIGKTTLARHVFNRICQQFDGATFLLNVRDTLDRHGGLEDLQKKLMRDILKRNDVNIKIFGDVLPLKKVLVVLDDVNKAGQIETILRKIDMLRRGSRIIVTTRDKGTLDEYNPCQTSAPNTRASFQYMPFAAKELDESDASLLFHKHAFKKDEPAEGYESVCRDILRVLGGFPLDLKVIASSLINKNIKFWESSLEKLRKIPDKDILGKLRISYDDLEREQKEIFLDIASDFTECDTNLWWYMWESCGFYPDLNITALESKCLVKKEINFYVHDRQKDLAAEIVGKHGSEKHSRLQDNEAYSLLKGTMGTKENVQLLSLDNRYTPREEAYRLSDKESDFANLRELRFLDLGWTKLEGDFTWDFPELRWFKWSVPDSVRTQISFCAKKLAILDLSHSFSITEDWGGWSLIKEGSSLRVVILDSCMGLRKLPEELGFIVNLEILSASECDDLREIPDTLGNLSSLKRLDLAESRLNGLPDPINLPSLVELVLSSTELSELPESIGSLRKLEKLLLSGCKRLERCPISIGNLESLITLDISKTPIRRLPDGIWKLPKLQVLDANYCLSLKLRIPGDISAYSLRSLKLSGTGLQSLPESVRGLSKLEVLSVSSTRLKWPPELELPSSLTTLYASHLPKTLVGMNLQEPHLSCFRGSNISEAFEALPRTLRILWLTKASNIRTLPTNIKELSGLEALRIIECHRLEYIPQLPSSLEHLYVSGCNSLEKPGDLSNLSNLTTLYLHKCSEIYEIEGLAGLSSLNQLEVRECSGLLRLDCDQGLTALRRLVIEKNDLISSLGDLSKLSNLEDLFIEGCPEIHVIEGLSGLASVTKLSVWKCKRLRRLDGIQGMTALRWLDIIDNDSLETVPDLSNLTNLVNSIIERNGKGIPTKRKRKMK